MLSPETSVRCEPAPGPGGQNRDARPWRKARPTASAAAAADPCCSLIGPGAITCGLSVSHRTYLYHNRPRTKGASLMTLLARLLVLADRVSEPRTAYAHCDLPCGVYDPVQAKVEADSVKAIIEKYNSSSDEVFRAVPCSSKSSGPSW